MVRKLLNSSVKADQGRRYVKSIETNWHYTRELQSNSGLFEGGESRVKK